MSETIITQRDPKYAKTSSYQGGMLDVLNALKRNIFRNLNVASIGEVQKIDSSTGNISVKLLPLKTGEISRTIDCQSGLFPVASSEDGSIQWKEYIDYLSIKDIVLIVYTNRNSSQNILQARQNLTLSSISKTELHSEKFGIIVGIIVKSTIKEAKQ